MNNGEISMIDNGGRYKYIVDTIIIFLNLSTSYSIIPYLLFHQYDRYINLFLVAAIDFLYYCFRFKYIFVCPFKRHPFFYLYILINISCLLSAVLTNTGWKSVIAYVVVNAFFYYILFAVYSEYIELYSRRRAIWLILRAYIIIAAISVIGSVILFFYIKYGGDPYKNFISTKYDLFYDNYYRIGSNHYFPFNMAIIDAGTNIRIPFFQEKGMICGLYHEPHILTFMVFPAFFLLLYYVKNVYQRIIVFLFYFLILLLAGSTTNIFALVLCALFYVMYSMSANLKHSFVLLGVIGCLLLLVFKYFDFDNLLFIADKVEGSSAGYSQSTMMFAFTPRTLFGSSFYNLGYVDWNNPEIRNSDVGIISFLLNLLFMAVCALKMLKLYTNKDTFSMSVFFFAAYFFLHSTKVAMVSYSLSMLIFVCFILTVASENDELQLENSENNVCAFKKNII